MAVIGLTLGVALTACGVTGLTSSGISVPAGPQLGEFGLTPRCRGEDSSCTDRALEIAEETLQRLGPALPPAEPPGAGAELIVPFTVQVDRDPPWEWRSSDEDGGSVAMATIDLEPYLAGRGDAIVRLGGDDPGYPAPRELVELLVDALFVR